MSNLVVHKFKSHGQSGHITTRPQRTAQSKLACTICGQTFAKKALLTAHQLSKHNTKSRSKTVSRVKKSSEATVQVTNHLVAFLSILFSIDSNLELIHMMNTLFDCIFTDRNCKQIPVETTKRCY